jgi:hypothetical protein
MDLICQRVKHHYLHRVLFMKDPLQKDSPLQLELTTISDVRWKNSDWLIVWYIDIYIYIKTLTNN